jgi:hypothetical protein
MAEIMDDAWRCQFGEPFVVQPVGRDDETKLPDRGRQIPETHRTPRREHSLRGIYPLPRLVESSKHEQRLHLADALVIAAPLQRPRRQLLEDRTGERRRCLAIASKEEEARRVYAGVIGFGVTRIGLFGEDRLIQLSGLAQL